MNDLSLEDNLSTEEIDMLARFYLESELKLKELGWGCFKRKERDITIIYLMSPKQLERANNIVRNYGSVEDCSQLRDEIFGVRPRMSIQSIASEGMIRVDFDSFPYQHTNVDNFYPIYGTKDYVSLMDQFLTRFLRYAIDYLQKQERERWYYKLNVRFISNSRDGADLFKVCDKLSTRYSISSDTPGFVDYELKFRL